MEKSYVKYAEHFVHLPRNIYIKMGIVVGETGYTCIIRDRKNWIYHDMEGRLKFAEPAYPIKDEKSLYAVEKNVIDLKTGVKRSLMPIEQEMALDFLFEHCGDEMKNIRIHEEARMMILFGMSEDELNSLSEKELRSLREPYQYSGKNNRN